jgi:hypothetical protein
MLCRRCSHGRDPRTKRLPHAFLAMALAVSVGTVDRATAQGLVKSIHNDWQVWSAPLGPDSLRLVI